MDEIRLNLVMSPSIEFKVINNSISNNDINNLFKLKKVIEDHKNFITCLLPIELKSYFESNSLLNIFLSSIMDRESNFIFQPYIRIDCLSKENMTLIFPENPFSYYTNTIILSFLSKNEYPFIFSSKNEMITKKECTVCNVSNSCKENIELETFVPKEDLNDSLKDILNLSIENMWLTKNNIDTDRIKFFIISVSFYLGFSIPKNIDTLFIHKDFIEDIKKSSRGKLKNILYSIFRSFCFPSISNKSRMELSIDWHRNDPYRISSHCIYRCDVVEFGFSGKQNSGADRIIFSTNNDNKYYIAFTETHDVESDKLVNRINSI